MKKVVSLVLSLAFLMSCLCLSGCNNQQKQNPTANDLVEALKNGGYEEAYFDSNRIKQRSEHCTIEIPGIENDLYIWTVTSNGDTPIARDVDILNYDCDVNREDTIKILNIIMPLFDDDFDIDVEDILDYLEKSLSKNKSSGRTVSDAYEYHDICYSLSDNGYIFIFVDEVYRKRNDLTLEEYHNQSE